MANLNVAELPTILSLTNKGETPVDIKLYPDNGQYTIAAGDELVYEVRTSREFLYYYDLAKQLGLEIAVVDDSGDEAVEGFVGYPADYVIKNETDQVVELALYPDNGKFILNPEDELTLKVESAREGIYYFIEARQLGLTISQVKKEPPTETPSGT